MNKNPRAMRVAITVAIATSQMACSGDEPEEDPLDPALLAEIAQQGGSASGNDYAGSWSFGFSQRDCDCPSFEFAGEPLDLCGLVGGTLAVDASQSDGYFAVTFPDQNVLTGPIDADGHFILVGNRDLATAAGPLQQISRIDGDFADASTGMGDAAQRLVGSLADQQIDCRWTGALTAMR